MTKDERDAVCAALKESLHEQIAALPEDGTWPFIKSVTLSEDGRSAEILSTKDLYKPERDNAAAQAVYIPALLYAAFTGEDAENFTVHFTVKDETTGDVLGEFDYPAAEPTASESDASGTENTAPPTRRRRINRIQKRSRRVYHPCGSVLFTFSPVQARPFLCVLIRARRCTAS
mgnify:CR=1 FL=1